MARERLTRQEGGAIPGDWRKSERREVCTYVRIQVATVSSVEIGRIEVYTYTYAIFYHE